MLPRVEMIAAFLSLSVIEKVRRKKIKTLFVIVFFSSLIPITVRSVKDKIEASYWNYSSSGLV